MLQRMRMQELLADGRYADSFERVRPQDDGGGLGALAGVFARLDRVFHEDGTSLVDAMLREATALLGADHAYFCHGAGAARCVVRRRGRADGTGLTRANVCARLHAAIAHAMASDAVVASRAAGAPALLRRITVGGRLHGVAVLMRSADGDEFDNHDHRQLDLITRFGLQLLERSRVADDFSAAALETVSVLARVIDAKDNYTAGHSDRVGWLARLTGETLSLSDHDQTMLEWAGVLHDVGKVGIPRSILSKPGRLTDEEMAQMRRHPEIGYHMIRPVSGFRPLLDAVRYHHENLDGSGYPHGLAGSEIPLYARILRVADAFDAMIADRPYRSRRSVESALGELHAGAGRDTDTEITAAFRGAVRQLIQTEPLRFRGRFPAATL